MKEKYTYHKTTSLNIIGEKYESYNILKDGIPMYTVNSFLNNKASSSINTAKQYASRLIAFFNYLDKKFKKTYLDVQENEIESFMKSLCYEMENVFYIKPKNVTYSTVKHYLSVIKSFYTYVAKSSQKDNLSMKIIEYDDKYYGGILDVNINDYFKNRYDNFKSPNTYKKWYTDDEKKLLLSGFNTYRDKAVFLLLLEGRRIDEVLAIRLIDYDSLNSKIKLYRSKGKKTGKFDFIMPISGRVQKAIEDYLFYERDMLLYEALDSNQISIFLFINLQPSKQLGKPLSYDNYRKILLRVAKKTGFDLTKIRTHNGRSTKAMDLLLAQAEYPELMITDDTIRATFNWKSIGTIDAYKDFHNVRTNLITAKKMDAIRGEKDE